MRRSRSIDDAGELERLQGMVEFLLCRLKEVGIDTPPSLLDGFELPPAYDVPLAPRRRYKPASRPQTASSRSSSDAGIRYGPEDLSMGTRSHSPFRHTPPSPLANPAGETHLTTNIPPGSDTPTFRSISSSDGFSYSLVHFPTQDTNHVKRYQEAVAQKGMQKL